jgi:predicted DNA-binding WGR domain protein
MAQTIKKARLEFHDGAKNSHKFYEVCLDQLSPDSFQVRAIWGRCSGYGKRAGKYDSQVKDVVGDVISALVVYQDWICAKEKRGYQQVQVAVV